MIDKEWVEKNIKDEDIKSHLIYIVTGEHFNTIQEVIDEVIDDGEAIFEDYIISFKNLKELEERIDLSYIILKTLRLLDTFID